MTQKIIEKMEKVISSPYASLDFDQGYLNKVRYAPPELWPEYKPDGHFT